MKIAILKNHVCFTVFFKRLFLLLGFFIFSFSSFAQCYASSTVSGSAAANDNTVGTLAFANTSSALLPDNSMASATAVVSLFTGSSQYLKVTGFGFNIPSYSSVCGVVVEIEKMATGLAVFAWIRDNQVKLVKANTVVGNNLGATGADWTGTNTYYTHGGAANLWGTTLTPADVNSSNFGVAISAKFNGLVGVFPSAQIDHIRMTVYYNPILPVHIISFSSLLKNNTALLKWKTADEEVNDIVILQRSATGSSHWTDIAQFQTTIANNGKEYSYNDMLDAKGNYSYRLKISNSISNNIYSDIKNVQYAGNNSISIYPNPASSFIIINSTESITAITIRNIMLQQLQVPVQMNGSHSLKADISSLPKGIYFALIGHEQVKFIKE